MLSSKSCVEVSAACENISETPHGVICVALTRGAPLQLVRCFAEDVRDAQLAQLTAEVEGFVVEAVIDHGTVELHAPEQVEGVDRIRSEMNARATSTEGIGKPRAIQQ